MVRGRLRPTLSRVWRWARAVSTFLAGLKEHARESGAPLPSLPHRICEQGRLLLTSGITPTNYYRYRLYRTDMSADEKTLFLGYFDSWRWLLTVNGPASPLLVSDKIIASRLLHSCGIPHPRCMAVFGLPQGQLDRPDAERTRAALARFLSQPDLENFFLKPVHGRSGAGQVSVGRRIEGVGWELLPQRTPMSAAELTDKIVGAGVPYMAEERMIPHPALGCFGTDVLHTIRFITVLDGDVQIAQAALKIGIGDLPVDNLSKGNVVAGIDVATGVIGSGWMLDPRESSLLPQQVEIHPRTKARIPGHRIPLWQEAVAVLRQAASCFHVNSVVAWDLAITDRGPVVIEANSDPNWNLTQIGNDQGLLTTALGAYLHRHGHLDKVGVGSGLAAIYERCQRGKDRAAGKP